MATVETTITMSKTAVEKSTFIIPISAFYDDNGTGLTPDSITWSLHDGDDSVVNSKSAVSVTAATAIDIVLSGSDLAIADNSKASRYVTVEYTFTSTAGSALPGKQAIWFDIQPLNSVT